MREAVAVLVRPTADVRHQGQTAEPGVEGGGARVVVGDPEADVVRR
ncbi:hypothetical protein ABT116_06600 [Streptomyces sp. NPDC002130]